MTAGQPGGAGQGTVSGAASVVRSLPLKGGGLGWGSVCAWGPFIADNVNY
jgi:hypothetical protein